MNDSSTEHQSLKEHQSPTEHLELWLIRHGQSTSNKEGRIQGFSNAPLTDLGKEQATLLNARLKDIHFDKLYASDLERAFNTAEIATKGKNLEIVPEKHIREINLGDFEGRLISELSDEEQAECRVWFLGPFDQKVPGGESRDDLSARAQEWLESLPKKGRIAAFSHGGIIAAMLQLFTGRLNESQKGSMYAWHFKLDNTSICKLIITNTNTIVSTVNDRAHLQAKFGEA